MATIDDLYEAVQQIKLREELPAMIKKTEYFIVQKIVNQHNQGQLSTGAKITPSYRSPLYASFKQSLNPAAGYGTPDGKVTGLYNSELHVDVTDTEYEIYSTAPYAGNNSILQYGDDFNRLSEKSKEEYCDEALLPVIHEYITEKTGLTFN